MQIKSTMRNHHIYYIDWNKMIDYTTVGYNGKEFEYSYTAGGSYYETVSLENNLGLLQNAKNETSTRCKQSTPTYIFWRDEDIYL